MEQFVTEIGIENHGVLLMGQVFLVVLGVMVFNFIFGRVVHRFERRAESTATPWDTALVQSVNPPMRVLIWIVGITFAADIVARETGAPIFDLLDPTRTIGIIACLTWFLVRLVENTERAWVDYREREGRSYDRTTLDAVGKLVRASIIITAILVGLQSLGISVSGVLAFGGIGGIAIGFAAKDLLANFFGGLMIYLDRPFAVGDWIRSPDQEIEGTVEEIGWRLTRIRRFDKRPIYVPNSVFTSVTVENPSRMTHRRIFETIGIRYGDLDKMAAITADVKKMLMEHPEIATDQTMIVNFNSFNNSSLDFFVYAFTKTTAWVRYHEIKEDILLRVAKIIGDHGAEIAFPTRTLHLPDGVRVDGPATPAEALAAPGQES